MTDDDRAPEIDGALIDDGYDPVRLLTAEDVADLIQVPVDAVYGLPIRRVQLSSRRVRFRLEDLQEFIEDRHLPESA